MQQSAHLYCAGPARPHTNTAPIVPVLEKLPPPPQPEPQPEVQADANGDAPAEEDATPEAPEQVRRRQLLRILIPDDNEVPVSDDEPGEHASPKPGHERASFHVNKHAVMLWFAFLSQALFSRL